MPQRERGQPCLFLLIFPYSLFYSAYPTIKCLFLSALFLNFSNSSTDDCRVTLKIINTSNKTDRCEYCFENYFDNEWS
jgi:hypothetical protein